MYTRQGQLTRSLVDHVCNIPCILVTISVVIAYVALILGVVLGNSTRPVDWSIYNPRTGTWYLNRTANQYIFVNGTQSALPFRTNSVVEYRTELPNSVWTSTVDHYLVSNVITTANSALFDGTQSFSILQWTPSNTSLSPLVIDVSITNNTVNDAQLNVGSNWHICQNGAMIVGFASSAMNCSSDTVLAHPDSLVAPVVFYSADASVIFSSDLATKIPESIEDIDPFAALNRLLRLRPRTYRWLPEIGTVSSTQNNNTDEVYGFIAQEVATVYETDDPTTVEYDRILVDIITVLREMEYMFV